MRRRESFVRRSTFLATAASLLLVAAGRAEAPAIARPGLARIGASAADSRGVVFFLASDLAPGMVAVGTAHTVAPEQLARAQRMEVALPGSLAPVAVSERYAVAPGRPFNAADGTLRGDFALSRLAATPRGVRALSPETEGVPAWGAKVGILGPGPRGEDAATGVVTAATAERIEVQLDAARVLDGWGGAPVLGAETGRVIGIVEAAVPSEGAPRVLAAPIAGVVDALRDPLDGGKGRRFAELAPKADTASAAGQPAGRRGLIQPTSGKATHLELSIEYPRDGDQVSSTACGTFVAGH